MAATARVARTDLPMPRPADPDNGNGSELEAIDAVHAAYMAMNATGASGMAWDDGPRSPMSLLAKAGRVALMRIPGVSNRDAAIIWEGMCDGGSGAQWVYNLWRNGEI